jgi:hypothetical protein
MAYDYSKLSGRIKEKYGTNGKFAKALGLSEHSFSKKITNKARFKQSEITKSCELLEIPYVDVGEYFFKLEVQSA